jgi:mRNA interferase RelE/StbE
MYKVEFSKKVRANKIPQYDLKRIMEKINELVNDPHSRWTEKVKTTDLLRMPIGNYRVLYKVDDDRKLVLIHDIDHRKQTAHSHGGCDIRANNKAVYT